MTRWITPRLSRSLSLRYWHFSLRCTTRPQPDVEGDSPSSHGRSEPICNRIILAKHGCRRRTEQFQWVLALLVAVCRSGKVSLALLLHWKELQLLCVVVVLSLKVFLALFRRLRDRAAAPSKGRQVCFVSQTTYDLTRPCSCSELLTFESRHDFHERSPPPARLRSRAALAS